MPVSTTLHVDPAIPRSLPIALLAEPVPLASLFLWWHHQATDLSLNCYYGVFKAFLTISAYFLLGLRMEMEMRDSAGSQPAVLVHSAMEAALCLGKWMHVNVCTNSAWSSLLLSDGKSVRPDHHYRHP